MKILLPEVELINDSYGKNILRFQKRFCRLFLVGAILLSTSISSNANVFTFIKTENHFDYQSLRENFLIDENWILDTTVNNVTFYHKIIDCGGKNAVLLKFDNLNSKTASISFKESFTTKQVKEGLDGYFGVKEITLNTGLTSPANCEDLNNPKLIVLSQQVDPTYLSDILTFSFKEIKVVQL
ncbi:hypothetical protein [Pedobacter cryophilus]|uniref:Uncharacterized protein n=1 Tax=Pedobacter cryophilus TaxID=2571271 RepID=A0A4U1BXV6_9SPHI|nr:hypothetical protein [Pedobacter cryophilus]TKB96386.1 hypothetical protein FA046_14515 [Pedobacter cryophilus]